MVMRWAQVPIRLGASLPRSSADFGIGVTFQQLFFYLTFVGWSPC